MRRPARLTVDRAATTAWLSRAGPLFLFGAFMAANAFAYLYQMLLSRTLAPPEYGAMVTLTSIFYVLAVFWRAGQAWVIDAVAGSTRAVPVLPRSIVVIAVRALLPIGLLVVAASAIASPPIVDFLHLRESGPILVVGAYLATSFLLPVAVGIPLGLQRLLLASGVIVIEPIIRLGLGLALVALGLGLDGALGGYVAGNIAAFVAVLILLRPALRRAPRAEAAPPITLRLDRYAVAALAINAGLMTIASVDLVLVKHFFDDNIAGNYAVAFLLGRIMSMGAISLAWVIFVQSATLDPSDPKRAQLLARAIILTVAIALPFTAAYLIAPSVAVLLMAGPNYSLARQYVGLVGVEMALFSLVYVQVYYHLSVRQLRVIWPLIIATVAEIVIISQLHGSIEQVLVELVAVMGTLLVVVSLLSVNLFRGAALPHSVPHADWPSQSLSPVGEPTGGTP
jgi:O-antigen/teichoic acid export membrane protein